MLTRPGRDSRDGIPLGNGEVGALVWSEAGGGVVLLLSRTDCYDRNGRLLRIGRVRFRAQPEGHRGGRNGPLRSGEARLRLSTGELEIGIECPAHHAFYRVRVDAGAPVVHVDYRLKPGGVLTCSVESWRTSPRPLEGEELRWSAWAVGGGVGAFDPSVYPELFTDADDVLDIDDAHLGWMHYNRWSVWETGLRFQGLGDCVPTMEDPLLHRAFGAVVSGTRARRVSATEMVAGPLTAGSFQVTCHTEHPTTPDAWLQAVLAIQPGSVRGHRTWWRSFWDRSRIEVHRAGDGADGVERGFRLTQALALQRYATACAGRGRFPVKFNGSLFCPDPVHVNGREYDPDFRAWGGDFWFQNTRLIYWTLYASGDLALSKPFFRLYRDALDLGVHRNWIWLGIGGAVQPETMTPWGMYGNGDYGYGRSDPGAAAEAGPDRRLPANPFVRYYWQGGLELLLMAVEYLRFGGDHRFRESVVEPLASAYLRHYAEFYRPDGDGRRSFEPASSLETWHCARNPTPDLAALRAVLPRLIDLFPEVSRREAWPDLLASLPQIPVGAAAEGDVILPAGWTDGRRSNYENPELYAVWPYRIYGIGRPDLERARRTYRHREMLDTNGWQQAGMQAAVLGLADEAARIVLENLDRRNRDFAFPAMWGPNYDWVPDQDHGSNLITTVQLMLVQWDESNAYVFPALPGDWDVSFRLHGPGVTIDGRQMNGLRTARMNGTTVRTRLTDPAGVLVAPLRRGRRTSRG